MSAATPAHAESAVDILSAEKTYPDGTQALLPVDLRIAPGEFVTLLGPSGCGKSTLLKMVAGLLEPSDGRLLLWRKPVAQLAETGKKMAFVFQAPTLMPWATVQANVRLPLDLAGVPRASATRPSRWRWSVCPRSPVRCRASSRAACRCACRSRAAWWCSPTCC